LRWNAWIDRAQDDTVALETATDKTWRNAIEKAETRKQDATKKVKEIAKAGPKELQELLDIDPELAKVEKRLYATLVAGGALVILGLALAAIYATESRAPSVLLRAFVVVADVAWCATLVALSDGLHGPFWAGFLLLVVFAVDIPERAEFGGFQADRGNPFASCKRYQNSASIWPRFSIHEGDNTNEKVDGLSAGSNFCDELDGLRATGRHHAG